VNFHRRLFELDKKQGRKAERRRTRPSMKIVRGMDEIEDAMKMDRCWRPETLANTHRRSRTRHA
jgi:hypothetical protein